MSAFYSPDGELITGGEWAAMLSSRPRSSPLERTPDHDALLRR